MYFTFFPEFLHLKQLNAFDLAISIRYPQCGKMEDSDNPHLLDIYKHNLKLFFDPITPPSLDILLKIQQNGFNLIHTGRDRWIFYHKDTELQELNI